MGVGINAKDNEGYTALTLAIKLQFKEAIDIFECNRKAMNRN